MSTLSTPSTSGLKTIPRTLSPFTPSRPTAKWSPLTPSEARALIQSQRYPGTAPPFVLPPERRNMPQSEINRLSHIIGRENTLKRTLHYIPDPSAVVPAPATPDQRILYAFRRKSYSESSPQRDITLLW
ncbi:hypothetical protein K438DRAFT_1962219 [Mycena galopus ATCC 62051]|nr:hypothetical protein K438DRAFT_1962219 [Mycena galopus ATCC 62051]